MTQELAQFQAAFTQALFATDGRADGALASLTAQPAFAVYRNTVMKGCVDALEANFPSVARLVGREWFRAAAALYVAARPPLDARLLRYGAGFAEFLESFEPAAELPYLSGVARLDRSWAQVHAAADAVTDTTLFAALAPQELGGTRVATHPAARWHWFHEMPIFSIWSRNRSSEAEDGDIELNWQGEGALLTRRDGAVVWQAASEPECAFLDRCRTGALLSDAAGAALKVQPDVDLAGLLATLLRAGALIAAPAPPTGATP